MQIVNIAGIGLDLDNLIWRVSGLQGKILIELDLIGLH